MKKTIILILALIISLFGCTKSRVKGSLDARSYANQHSTLTLFPIKHRDKKFTGCLQRQLKKDLPNLKFIHQDKFREALFPWFEPNSSPKDIEELSKLLRDDLIRNRLEDVGVELLIFTHGVTTHSEYDGLMITAAGPGAGAFLGYTSTERDTHISTSIWYLKEGVSIGGTDIHVKGRVRWFGLIIPIPVPAFTERAACSETAKLISDCLTAKVPHGDKSDTLN